MTHIIRHHHVVFFGYLMLRLKEIFVIHIRQQVIINISITIHSLGNLIINDEEANILRFIFRLYLDGYSVLGIIGKLKSCHIKSPSGRNLE